MANPIGTSTPLPAQTGGSGRTPTRESEAAAGARQELAAGGSTPPAQRAQQTRDTAAQQQSAQELAQATSDISDYIQTVSRSLQISVDSDLGTTVIKVMDTETEELVRQIPAEEVLRIARFLSEQQSAAQSDASLRGVLLDQEG
jgi:flagellar protein FlaG